MKIWTIYGTCTCNHDSRSQALIFFYYHHVDSFQGYKMDDLLTSYISLMLTSMNKQKSVKKWGRRREKKTKFLCIPKTDICNKDGRHFVPMEPVINFVLFIKDSPFPFIHDNPVQNPFLLQHGRYIPVFDFIGCEILIKTLWNQVMLMVVGTSPSDLLCSLLQI